MTMYDFDGLPYVMQAVPEYQDNQGMIRAKQNEWLGLYMANSTFYQRNETVRANGSSDEMVTESWSRGSLHPYKMVCTELANGIFNEGTEFKTAGSANDWLQGWVAAHDYQTICNKSTEWAMALGTAAQLLSFSDIAPDGVPAPNSDVDIVHYDAQNVYPVSYTADDVSEIAFALLTTYNGEWAVQVSVCKHETDGWAIYNTWYQYGGADLSRDKWSEIRAIEPDDLAPVVRLGHMPPFAILRPAIANIYAPNTPLGVSAFDDAIPAGKLVDLAFANFMNDIELGQKMVFLDEGMLHGKRGNLTVPFDVKKRLFVNIDRGIGENASHIDEYNPSLRSEENLRALSTALSMLGLRAGFGAEHWKLDRVSGSIQTATATMMARQDMVLTFKRHENSFRRPIQDMLSCMLEALGYADARVDVAFDDSILQDTDRQREIDRQEVAAGLMPKWVYVMKWNAVDEQTARQWVADTETAYM